MLKKMALMLMLLLLLALPAALAENSTPYTPCDMTKQQIIDAFNRGDMLTLDMAFDLALAENAGEVFGEDTALLASIAEALQNAKLTVGVGKLQPRGLRVTLTGDYTVGADCAVLSAVLDLTYDGIAITGSFMRGETFTAKWETILALCELSEEEIAAVLSLRDTDLELVLAQLAEQLLPLLEMAAEIATPYGETILTHIAALPMVVNENVPAEYGYPAAATEVQIQVTPEAFGNLVIALAEQLKQDATLCAFINMLMTEAGESVTAAQLCDALIQSAQEWRTAEALPLNIFIGSDAAGNLLYLNIIAQYEDNTYDSISYIAGQMDDSDDTLICLDVLSMTAEQEVINGISIALAYDIDDSNRNIMSAEVLFSGYIEGQEIITFTLSTNNAAADFEGNSGYMGQTAMVFSVQEDEPLALINMNVDHASIPLAGSSEELIVAGSMTITAEGEEIPMTFEAGMLTEAPSTTYTQAVQVPSLGIAEWRETYTLTASVPEPDADTTLIALEAATQDELQALATRIMESLEMTLYILSEILPPELVSALG